MPDFSQDEDAGGWDYCAPATTCCACHNSADAEECALCPECERSMCAECFDGEPCPVCQELREDDEAEKLWKGRDLDLRAKFLIRVEA